jgi:hypothetical protein
VDRILIQEIPQQYKVLRVKEILVDLVLIRPAALAEPVE